MLTDRQRMILNAIVDDYIRSAEPVGSRSISKRGDVGFSPATIRNEMSDLEELGFLEQPHTSAGRIPSIKGYRYYVDHLVKPGGIQPKEAASFRSFFAERITEMEQVMQQAATILASMTNYTSIALGPDSINHSLKHFQLVPLNAETAVAIVVTNTGHVENRTISLPEGISVSDLEKTVHILNAKLAGVPMMRLTSKLYSEVGEELSRYVDHYEQVMSVLESALPAGDEHEHRVYLSGATNMLTQPEFKDVDKIKTILDLLEETPTLSKMLSSAPSGIQVRIGTENELEAINDCSVITATYAINGQSLGTIGILGPTRMDYAKVISLLDVVSKDMTSLLSRWYR
ncbi:heat-inducible transcriptional repressor HrcA [Paenibacillus xylaniclasticus]|uniref:heat-inducible transcriptional repressor HrcA n=1 Tax=Paenibacillus xylaniclasticus TaxID=588083 RepID=UPI000FD95F6B|nr:MULTISPECIES: heat-inducible transcriptional repressor HrcA [Paenibacillus]GFN30311.1 heat-inducible transcription repressor HrcA [Paenibacillus curdlanolyticus]